MPIYKTGDAINMMTFKDSVVNIVISDLELRHHNIIAVNDYLGSWGELWAGEVLVSWMLDNTKQEEVGNDGGWEFH